jgi:hypothetical protein
MRTDKEPASQRTLFDHSLTKDEGEPDFQRSFAPPPNNPRHAEPPSIGLMVFALCIAILAGLLGYIAWKHLSDKRQDEEKPRNMPMQVLGGKKFHQTE